MSAKTIFAGILAGIVLYLWGFFTHLMIPLGEVGIQFLPTDAEQTVSTTLVEQIPEPGLYFLPGRDRSLTGEQASSEMERWSAAYQRGPTAFMVFHPTGETPLSSIDLGTQCVLDILIGLGAAMIVSFIKPTQFVFRVLLVMTLGGIAFLQTDAAYFGWYRFPADYTLGRLADHIGGMALVGIVLAGMLRSNSSERTTPSMS